MTAPSSSLVFASVLKLSGAPVWLTVRVKEEPLTEVMTPVVSSNSPSSCPCLSSAATVARPNVNDEALRFAPVTFHSASKVKELAIFRSMSTIDELAPIVSAGLNEIVIVLLTEDSNF